MAEIGHVNPDLMGAAGFQTALHIGRAGIALQHRPMGHGIPAAGHHGHLLPIRRAAADGGVDRACILPEIPHDNAAVCPGQCMILKLCRQSDMGKVVLRRNDEAGGIPVNAVDNAGAQLPIDAGEGTAAVVHQGIDQRPVRVSRRGMYHQSLGLVDYNNVIVLVHHVQRDVLRDKIHRFRLRKPHRNGFPPRQAGILCQRFSIRRNPACLHKLLRCGAGQLRPLRQPCVQPLSGVLTVRLQDQRLHSVSSHRVFRRSAHSKQPPEWLRTQCRYPPR